MQKCLFTLDEKLDRPLRISHVRRPDASSRHTQSVVHGVSSDAFSRTFAFSQLDFHEL